MNELQVKTIEIKPAEITFNHTELEAELEKSLQKYTGLTFTEDDATECRSTIAELRKGKQAVDRYRIDTKNKLNEPVKAFEAKCKELEGKFDAVINPLIGQQDSFEIKRRAEKKVLVQEILDAIIEDYQLDHQRADELEVIDSYLTKSKSIKSITDELEARASLLELQQDKEKADKEMISTTVKLANSENDLNLSAEAYIRLLDMYGVEKVKDQIEHDAKNEVDRRIAKEEYLQRIKEDEAERKRILEEKKESLKLEVRKRLAELVAEEKIIETPIAEPIEEFKGLEDDPFEDLPFTDIDDPFADEELNIRRVYEVFATEEQLELLESFLKDNVIEWGVLDE